MFSSKSCHLLVRNLLAIRAPQSSANISTGCVTYQTNYYDALGIHKNCTQGEIKAAYYRLSMAYHPDKNQGSETAAIKFREISQAYEVLGNFRLRRLYDKGIIHTAGAKYADRANEATVYDTEPQPEDDPSTKFYKSRFTKSSVSDSDGRTPIYNFDEWARQHYGKTFDRRQTAKSKYEREDSRNKEQFLIEQKEILLVLMVLVCLLLYFTFLAESSYDTPKDKAIRLSEENKQKEKDTIT